MNIIRQGDILFKKVEYSVLGKSVKKLIIAEGEATGHNHVLVASGSAKISGNRTKFTITGKAKLVHPEHDTISFESGTYIVITEREHDYIENQMKVVKD